MKRDNRRIDLLQKISMFRFLLPILWLGFMSHVAARPQPKPNIIVILTDDQGYEDLGCFGAEDIATPNIDKLADYLLKVADPTVEMAPIDTLATLSDAEVVRMVARELQGESAL